MSAEPHIVIIGGGFSGAAVAIELLRLAPKLAAEFGCAVSMDADGVPSGGFKTLINSGPDGGQEVYHLHMHVYGGPRPWRGQH